AAEPLDEIGLDRGNAVLPDAFDRGTEIVFVLGGDARDDAVEVRARRLVRVRAHRQKARGAQLDVQTEEDVVDERALLEWIQLLERLGFFPGGQYVERVQDELVRARREILQRGRRVRPRVQLVLGERRLAELARRDEAVGRLPRAHVPACVPRAERPRE